MDPAAGTSQTEAKYPDGAATTKVTPAGTTAQGRLTEVSNPETTTAKGPVRALDKESVGDRIGGMSTRNLLG
jgi:hypothetical protein